MKMSNVHMPISTGITGILATLCIFGGILFSSMPLFSKPQDQPLTRNEIAEKINRIIDEEVQNTDLTGASIAVYYKGAPLISRGVGFADEPNQIKATEHTGFRIGSVTKLFTALSIMKLAEENKLSLDDSLFKYLPGYQPKVLPGVNLDNRIRDLLTHHSGIPSLWLKDMYVEKPSLALTRALPHTLSEDYLIGNRREVRAYNNSAYALAGLIIESASGKPYDDYIKEHFFDQFNMTDAHVFLPENQENIALSHNDHQSEKSYGIMQIPAGSIIASASDMNQFMKALMDTWHDEEDDLMDADTLKQMAVYQHKGVKYDLRESQGIGFFLKDKYGHKQLSKAGGMQSFASDFFIIPELEIGAFVCSNDMEKGKNGFFSEVTADKIIHALADLDIETRKESTLKNTSKTLKSKLPQTGKFLIGRNFTALYNKNQTSYIFFSDELSGDKFKLEPVDINEWQLTGTNMTLCYSDKYSGYYISFNSIPKKLLIPFNEYTPNHHIDKHIGRTYSAPAVFHNKISLILHYHENSKYGNYYYTEVSFNNELQNRFIQQPLSDTLLQVQGKGYECGLITEFIDNETIKFAGLTLKLERNPKTKGNRGIMHPKRTKEAFIKRLQSEWTTDPFGRFLP